MARAGFPFSIGRKWVYLFLIFFSCLALFLLFGLPHLLGPRLSKAQQQWQEFSRDDPKGHSLEVVGHGYRMVRAYSRQTRGASQNLPRIVNLVEWEWKIAVHNKSRRDLEVHASYFLVDPEHLLVDLDSTIRQNPAPAGETVWITHKTEMIYEYLPRVLTGVWEISWEEGNAFLRTRRKGF